VTSAPPVTGAELDRLVTRLIGKVSHWAPPRWAAPGGVPGRSRAQLVHALVQYVADLAARAEGGPSRPVPVLDNDLALPYQLRVVTDDLLAATAAGRDARGRDSAGSAELLAAAAEAVAAAQRDLAHRAGPAAGGDRDRAGHQG
jgi:hypothetical protein